MTAFITESWRDSTVYDGEMISNSNYCIFRKDRNRHGVGVFIAVSNHLKPVHIHKFYHPHIELIWVEILCNHGTILLGCLYRPPNLGSQFFDELSKCVRINFTFFTSFSLGYCYDR